ncbi:folate synthesis bifunctional protein, mitochondrial isoform X1 [Salvia divinorum]|uniref:2-amino-4-hydroxy-6-hydroxymethyldihydropteridine diphosphokinase n=1 Tax=Salvia divinorum TaxID=28513 RepID=A0ABD1H4E9_SALDI
MQNTTLGPRCPEKAFLGMNFIKQVVPVKYGGRAAKTSFAAARLCLSRPFHDAPVEVNSEEQEVVIALGSNPGDRPRFLNSAVRGTTNLGPHKLLAALKEIERDLGRTAGIRYGPRPIDLDILFYGSRTVNTDSLTIPRERIWERPFVLAPLIDLLGVQADNETVNIGTRCQTIRVGSLRRGRSWEANRSLGRMGWKECCQLGTGCGVGLQSPLSWGF